MKQLKRPVIITLVIAMLCIAAFIGYAYLVNRKTGQASNLAGRRARSLDLMRQAKPLALQLDQEHPFHPGSFIKVPGSVDTVSAGQSFQAVMARLRADSLQLSLLLDSLVPLAKDVPRQLPGIDSLRQLLRKKMASVRGLHGSQDDHSFPFTISLQHMSARESNALLEQLLYHNKYMSRLYQFGITGGILLGLLLIMALLRINFIMHELRHTRSALGNRDLLYQQLVEDSGVLMYTANLEGYFQYISPQAIALTGYRPAELLERHYSLLLSPDVFEELHIFYEEQALRKEPTTTREVEMVTKQGEKKWVEQQVTLRCQQDKVIGFQAIVKDIHEKKILQLRMEKMHAEREEVQQLLLNVLAHTPTFVFIKDLYGRYLLVNKEFEKVTGHTAADIIGLTDLEVSQPAEARKWAASDQKAIDTKEPVKVIGSLERNGQICHYLVTKYPLLDKNNEVYGLGATGVDITDHIRRENELAEARANAEASRRVQEIFLANVSHELRTPINGITGMIYLLRKTVLSESQQEYADAIAASAEKLGLLVNDIQEISRIRAGNLQLEKGDLNLPLLLHKTMASVSPAAEAKGLNLYCDLDEHIPTRLTGDALRLGQVFGALMENAVKFTAAGNVQLTAMLLEETQDAVRIGIEVRDTGMGIHPDQLDTIFETYAHAAADTALYFGGAGLGLAICKEIIHQYGGSITVKSEPGAGAVFYVELPLEKYHTAALPPRQALTGQSLEGKKVLLAEDNPINQKVVRYTLQQTGASVDVVADGLSAMQLMMQKTYDCMLMDLQMPEMNGYEAMGALRRLGFTTPAIAITASTQREDTARTQAAGFNEYIAKPFPPDELVYKILDLLKPLPTAASSEAAPPLLVDFDYLYTLTQNDQAYLAELLDTFTRATPENLGQLALALNETRWQDVQFWAHRMRASLSVVRIPALTQLMLELEADAGKASAGAAQKRLQSAQLLYEEAKAAIAAVRQTLHP